jgi:hypothetical protein
MKIKIGNYKSWFGPYQLAEKLCFWAPKIKDEYGFPRTQDWVHDFGEWLAYGSVRPDPAPGDIANLFNDDRDSTWLCRFLTWIDHKRKRTEKIHIDRWDTWSMDHTLALIILPMLKQLRASKQGAPMVDIKDVPKELHGKKLTKKQKDQGEVDDKHFERWDWILSEMIFAFEHLVDEDWEDQFRTGEYDLRSQVCEWDEAGKPTLYEMVEGPGHTAKTDYDGVQAVYDRIDRGLLFFGKYYRNLWD